MSSKKKLVISLSVAAAVLVAAIIAIVAVFAAAQQTVQSSFTIKFTASDVACKVDGSWAIENADTTEGSGEFGSLGTVVIAAANAKDTYSMDVSPEIPLTSEKNYVDLTYTFTNNGSRSFTIAATKAAVSSPLSMQFLDEDEKVIDDEVIAGVQCDTTMTIIVRIELDSSAFANDIDPVAVNLNWDLAAINS